MTLRPLILARLHSFGGTRVVCQQCRHFVSFEQSSAKRGIGGSKKRENAGSYGQDHGRSKRFLGVSVRKFEWTAIPTSLGLACIAVVGFRHSWKRHQRDQNRAAEAAHVYNGIEVEDWRIKLALLLPTRSLSRAWGWAMSLYIPVWMRQPLYGLFVYATGANMDEAVQADLQQYDRIVDLFKRDIKSELRPINKDNLLVSPCDGEVVHVDVVDHQGKVEQIKGVTYPIHALFGPGLLPSWVSNAVNSESAPGQEDGEFEIVSPSSFLPSGSPPEDLRLYQCIIYLSPADYHRFHSPTEWKVMHRRHFAGALLPVKLAMWSWVKGLMPLNERVVLAGAWRHGFFSYTAVGATNVGSMHLAFDQDLKTNQSRVVPGFYQDKALKSVDLSHGSLVGEFQLGSTIALVFEAPADFKFSVKAGDKVQVGAAIGNCG